MVHDHLTSVAAGVVLVAMLMAGASHAAPALRTQQTQRQPQPQPQPFQITGKIQFVLDTATVKIAGDRTVYTLHLTGLQPIPNPEFINQMNRWLRVQPPATCIEVKPASASIKCQVGSTDLAYVEVLNGLGLPLRASVDADPVLNRANEVARETQRGLFSPINSEVSR